MSPKREREREAETETVEPRLRIQLMVDVLVHSIGLKLGLGVYDMLHPIKAQETLNPSAQETIKPRTHLYRHRR
jgi:hypothetical protein